MIFLDIFEFVFDFIVDIARGVAPGEALRGFLTANTFIFIFLIFTKLTLLFLLIVRDRSGFLRLALALLAMAYAINTFYLVVVGAYDALQNFDGGITAASALSFLSVATAFSASGMFFALTGSVAVSKDKIEDTKSPIVNGLLLMTIAFYSLFTLFGTVFALVYNAWAAEAVDFGGTLMALATVGTALTFAEAVFMILSVIYIKDWLKLSYDMEEELAR